MKCFSVLSFFFFSTLLLGQSDSVQQLELLFVGDIMQHKPQIKAAQKGPNKYDFKSPFEYVQPLIQKADLAIGNLELTLPGNPPYQGYPQFRSPDQLASDLRSVGFDLLFTANNHSNDAGGDGVVNTIETLKSNGLYQTGTFKNKIERDLFYPLIIHKKGFKLGFLNYTYDTNGLKTQVPTYVNYIDKQEIAQDLEMLHVLRPDFIIVMMHWGKEYQLYENKKQRQLAQWLLDNGVDIIVGAHPHVVQPIKEYRLSESEKPITTASNADIPTRLVAYSLGNFISNQTKPYTDGGIMLSIKLEKRLKTKRTYLLSHDYIPVWRYVQRYADGKRRYFVLPVSASNKYKGLQLTIKDMNAMNDFVKHTRTRLNKERHTR